jgi:hypothetical protein
LALFDASSDCYEYFIFLPILSAPVGFRNVTLGAIGAILGGSLFIWGGYAWSGYSQKSDPGPERCSNGDNDSEPMGNDCGVDIDPQPRKLDAHAELKEQILSILPKDKPIVVMSIADDDEAMSFAIQIHEFLKQNGFPLAENGVSLVFFPAPVRGLQLRDDGKTRTFIVGAP